MRMGRMGRSLDPMYMELISLRNVCAAGNVAPQLARCFSLLNLDMVRAGSKSILKRRSIRRCVFLQRGHSPHCAPKDAGG